MGSGAGPEKENIGSRVYRTSHPVLKMVGYYGGDGCGGGAGRGAAIDGEGVVAGGSQADPPTSPKEKELLNLMCDIFEKLMLQYKNNMNQLSPTSKYKKSQMPAQKMLKVSYIAKSSGNNSSKQQEFESSQ